MFDFSHLPQNATISEFIGPSGIRTWQKPPNTTLVFMMCIGGGGGGGTGNGQGSTTSAGGGGGGGGGLTQALFLSSALPNSLYVVFDGNTGASGTAGAAVFINNYPSTSAASVTKYIQANGGGLGGPGASANGGSAGSGGAVVSNTTASLINTALYYNSQAGRAGIAGSTSAQTNQSIGAALPILGGCGGGGGTAAATPNAGGGFTSDIPLLVPNIAGGVTGGAPAGNSLLLNRPFLSIGGMGGGSSQTTPGGTGGTASGYGAGGGGGGAGTPTSSAGGRGGPAYACIIVW